MYFYHVLYITIYKCSGTLSQVSCPLVVSPTERDQLVTFVSPQGEICGIFPTSCNSLCGWSITVINLDSHKLQWWQGASFHHHAMSGQQHPENTQPEQQQPDEEEDSGPRIPQVSRQESLSSCMPLLITCITHHASCALWLSGTPVLGILSQY